MEEHIIADKTLIRTAKVISAIFTPFSIPFLAFLILFIFSYLRIMPLQYKLIVLGVVYCFTILMPTLTIFIFRKINGFSPEELVERKRRYIPFILTITSYVFCLLMMHRLNIPWYMTGIILSALVVMIICVIVNLKWKLSEHMAGAGAVIGGLVAFSALFSYNPVWWLCLFILVAGVLGTAQMNNCELSFATIATINGQTLHNHYHGNKVKPGDLFLIDAGAELPSGYCGDMSSTVPADKTFTPRQRAVYEIQNAMHLESVKALRPGIPYMKVYELSAQVMVEGLKELGLMKGNAEDAVREGAHALFYPHGLGHMMGMDVHDMENFGEVWVGYDGQPKSTQFGRKSQRLAIPLEPGFVHTVEPGIYFIPELIDLWRGEKKFMDFIDYDKVEEYRNFGGIRNEEDYLVTETGARRLGKKIPLTPEEVEALR